MSLAERAFALKSRTVRRRSGMYFAELLRNERLSPGEILALQARRSASLASFAARETAFYGRLFAEHGVDVAALEAADQWHRVPVIDRATVKANTSAILSTEADGKTTRSAMTGGSTGEPLRTKHDTRIPTLALAWRMYDWWGVRPWDDIARVARWGFGALDSMKNRVQWWPTTQVYLDASLIDVHSMARFHRALVRTRPALIEGYVGAMLEFADFLEAENLTIPTPMAVATTAAPLPETTRRRLESVLCAPVYDEYRGSEIGWMAGECTARNGLHVFADARRIEVVGPDGQPLPPGEVGDLVVTDLENRVFPLIRYRLGDRGALLEGECACGRPFPRIAQPEGRTTDVLRLPSGKAMNQRIMAMFGYHPDSVKLFQIHQHSDYSISVRVVLGDEPDAAVHVEAAVDELRKRVAGEVPVTIAYLDALPYTGGKTKYVISDVGRPSSAAVSDTPSGRSSEYTDHVPRALGEHGEVFGGPT